MRAEVQGDRVRAVVVRDRETGDERTLVAPYFLDATELGDLLPLAGVEFVVGAEGQAETGEPHAPERPRPDVQQAITCCFAMDYLEGQDHTIERPARVRVLARSRARARPPLAGEAARPDVLPTRSRSSRPAAASTRGVRGRGSGSTDGSSIPATSARDLPRQQRDHPGELAPERLTGWARWSGRASRQQQADREIARAKQLSLSLLYWLQTECPRPDGKTGWKGLRLRPDLVGTADGLAKAPYIRESRRIKAEFTVLEQHVGTDGQAEDSSAGTTWRPSLSPTASAWAVTGSTCIPAPAGINYIDISSLPFQVPLGALIPRRVENLLPACKNLGHDAHHQRLLPAASRRVGHRRGRRGPRGVLPGARTSPRGRAKHAVAAGCLPVATGGPGRRDRLAEARRRR